MEPAVWVELSLILFVSDSEKRDKLDASSELFTPIVSSSPFFFFRVEFVSCLCADCNCFDSFGDEDLGRVAVDETCLSVAPAFPAFIPKKFGFFSFGGGFFLGV